MDFERFTPGYYQGPGTCVLAICEQIIPSVAELAVYGCDSCTGEDPELTRLVDSLPPFIAGEFRSDPQHLKQFLEMTMNPGEAALGRYILASYGILPERTENPEYIDATLQTTSMQNIGYGLLSSIGMRVDDDGLLPREAAEAFLAQDHQSYIFRSSGQSAVHPSLLDVMYSGDEFPDHSEKLKRIMLLEPLRAMATMLSGAIVVRK
ncbi:hypothetical protein ACFL0V_05695 [Nanoarchaeota archaeon]